MVLYGSHSLPILPLNFIIELKETYTVKMQLINNDQYKTQNIF